MDTGKTIQGVRVWVAHLGEGKYVFVDRPPGGNGRPQPGSRYFGQLIALGPGDGPEHRGWTAFPWRMSAGRWELRLAMWADKPKKSYMEVCATKIQGWE